MSTPCRHFENGHCERGDVCGFLHLKREGGAQGGAPPKRAKTQLCRHFEGRGFCQLGAGCGFAHGPAELGTSGSSKELLSNYKTMVCNDFAQTGLCPRGEACSFAHGEADLHQHGEAQQLIGMLDETRAHPSPQYDFQTDLGAPPSSGNTSGFAKTKLCTHYMSRGSCPKGRLCGFAHGEHELGTAQTQPQLVQPRSTPSSYQKEEDFGGELTGWSTEVKQEEDLSYEAKLALNYKAVICNDFSIMGVCPKGDSCTWAHGEEELLRPGEGQAMGLVQGPPAPPVVEPSNEFPTTSGNNTGNGFKKMKLCSHFEANWSCPRESACGFAHGEEELGMPQTAPINGGPVVVQPPGRSNPKGGVDLRSNPSAAYHGNAAPVTAHSPEAKAAHNYKSMICNHFIAGRSCPRGQDCNFAHGEHELATPGATQAPPQATPSWGGKGKTVPRPVQPPTQQHQKGGSSRPPKFQLCRHHSNGYCQLGMACGFAHGEHELGAAQTGGKLVAPPGKAFMKTKICTHFASSGSCPRGAVCGFAHGEGELGTPQAQSEGAGATLTQEAKNLHNYKTTLCNEFSNTGFCPRSDDCNFAHGGEELMQPGEAKRMMEEMQAPA